MKQKRGKDSFSDEELIEAYNEYKNLGMLACHFEVPHVTVYRRCYKLGLEFKNGGHNKGKKIKYELDDILRGKHPQYQTMKLKKRLIEENIIEYECDVCKNFEWQGKNLTLQLDHINGNPTDHRLENLRLLCPNCHSQTDTFSGKNK